MDNFARAERNYLEPPTPAEPESIDEWLEDYAHIVAAVKEALHDKAIRLTRVIQDQNPTEVGQLIDAHYEATR